MASNEARPLPKSKSDRLDTHDFNDDIFEYWARSRSKRSSGANGASSLHARSLPGRARGNRRPVKRIWLRDSPGGTLEPQRAGSTTTLRSKDKSNATPADTDPVRKPTQDCKPGRVCSATSASQQDERFATASFEEATIGIQPPEKALINPLAKQASDLERPDRQPSRRSEDVVATTLSTSSSALRSYTSFASTNSTVVSAEGTDKKPSTTLRSLDSSISSFSRYSGSTAVDEKRPVPYSVKRTKSYSTAIAQQSQLAALENNHPLPPITSNRKASQTRYKWISFYRRLMVCVILCNVTVLAAMVARVVQHPGSFSYSQAATATGANLVVAVLMRQEHVINLLFHLACALPHSAPLRRRRLAAKMAYNNGGVHAGSAHSALLWYIFFTVLLVQQFHGVRWQQTAISVVTAAIVGILTLLIVASHPSIRRRYHDYWELSHRFGGWTAIAHVWAQIIIVGIADAHYRGQSIGQALIYIPTFWFLIIITCCLVYPWLRLKRLPVEATKLSNHATQLHFHDRNLPSCRGVRLAHNPLLECHGFATIPNVVDSEVLPRDCEMGYSVVISNAGNFTKGMIQEPPKHIWLRGAPTTGVMRLSSLFRPIVVVATGSGIGPCLSFLNVYPEHPMRIIWSARYPETTYQSEIMRSVLRADSKALIIDTKKTGTLNLVALTYALVQEIQAEAVMIISNPKVTQDVVYGMEARKIAAFGAIFDS